MTVDRIILLGAYVYLVFFFLCALPFLPDITDRPVYVQMWTAGVATISLVITAWFQIKAWNRDVRSRAIETLRGFEVDWDDDKRKKARSIAARYLLNPESDPDRGRITLMAVLNFFESLGYLYDEGVVEIDGIWHFFSSCILPWYTAGRREIGIWQDYDENLYNLLDKLYNAVREVECRKHSSNSAVHAISPQAVHDFLLEESDVAGDGSAAARVT